MYYVVQNREGRFNLLNPGEIRVSSWIGIYDDEGNLIKAVSVTDDEPIFFDDDEPEEIARQLERWLNRVVYTSEEDKIKDMIKFLRENSKELMVGKLKKDIHRINERIEQLRKEKEALVRKLNEVTIQEKMIDVVEVDEE
ncbi:MAG TPA: hypothetical protein ENH14_00355 [candidate division WOR-3 bacterium]|uniref:Uncharacterized protein n=1 Tax=candidate division WOR-3 bacterium TaxID=2052148 RepID=A0A7V0LTY5_UNCW3|nr:hypothetical protein [candidate division WOR-3 bacterium]